MEVRMKFRLCWCGRHGYFADPETGERLAGDVFSQSSAIEVVKILIGEGGSVNLNLGKLRETLRETSLPAEEPPWMTELMALDNKLDVSFEDLPESEDEISESIHGFLDTLFPEYRVAQRVLQ